MGITAAVLIRTAMQDLGILGAGESARGEDMQDGLRRLQLMIGGWSLEPLTAGRQHGQPFPITPGKSSYTIGPGQEFDTVRPVGQQSVVAAGLILNIYTPNQLEIPLGLMTYDQMTSIRVKYLQAPWPTHVIYIPGATAENATPPTAPPYTPLGTSAIGLWPVPTEANHIMLYINRVTPMFENLTTSYPVPDGLAAAIQHNLTVAMAPMYQVQPSPGTLREAARTLASLKRNNYQFADVAVDPMFTFGSGAGYDIYSGGTQRHG